ncbi:hypothetical protein Tco_0394619, partial [Tanacetum coccineum]
MAWRHHDSIVAVPFPGPREYNTSDVAKLWEVVISLRRPPLSVLYVAERLDDVPPKTSDIMVAEIPYRKVLDDKEKKKKKAEEKAAAKVPIVNIEAEMVVNKDAGRKGPRKKRRVRVGPQVHPDSEHVSSPTLNHAKPLEALVNEEHVYPPFDEGGQGNADASFAIKGHGDNQGGLSGLQTQPSPAHHSGRFLDTVEEPGHENVVLEMEA